MAAKTKTGGRKRGTPNKSTREAQDIMARLQVDPITNMCMIASRKVPCGTCIDKDRKPTGRTFYELAPGTHAHDCAITTATLVKGKLVCTCEGIGSRRCLSCGGSTWERINVAESLKANAELAQYAHAKRKAIEVSNPDGTMRPRWEVIVKKEHPPK